MPADQAAGLRRRSAQHPLRCIQCFFHGAESTLQLARALHQRGWTSLIVDSRARMFTESSARSLFDWRQQLARTQLHTLPLPFGDGWIAPGVGPDEPGLKKFAHAYDCIMFDSNPNAPDWVPMPGATQILIVEVTAAQASLLHAYALIKTLFHAGGDCSSVGLMGDAAACGRLRAACRQYLDPSLDRVLYSVVHKDDAFAALAVRMLADETSLTARSIQEKSETWP